MARMAEVPAPSLQARPLQACARAGFLVNSARPQLTDLGRIFSAMIQSWPKVHAFEGVLITLANPLAPSLAAGAACLDMDAGTLSGRLAELGLAPPRQRRGEPMGLPPARVLCFMQFAEVTEPTLDMPVWPTLAAWVRAYLRLVLRLAPSFAAAGGALQLNAQVLARKTRALGLPDPPGRGHEPMPAPPVELALLRPPPASSVGPGCLTPVTTFSTNRLPTTTNSTHWLLPRQAA